ncbi:MAG: nitroreductase family protein [Actinomycetota bacterium]|jgi:nitroreductase|nr:nitroreductase family protein [Actinomycetota bacterium]
MEFKQVVGRRRSIRWFKPWRPVEREKIQVMLEAANRASRSMNADYPRALVVYRDDLSEELREALRNPTTSVDLDLAPVYIFWYFDMEYPKGTQARLKELVGQSVLPAAHGWSDAYVDEFLWPQVLAPIAENPAALMFMGATETGIAICNALNAAVDEGLGTCLHAFTAPDKVKELFGVPDSWFPVWMQLVGYPLEEPEAGGQRPRKPLGELFFEGSCSTPWREDEEVSARLRAGGMIQEPGPFPYREQEVRMLSRMFGLPDGTEGGYGAGGGAGEAAGDAAGEESRRLAGVLESFCAFVGADGPDALVERCLRTTKHGDLALSAKGRREIDGLIDGWTESLGLGGREAIVAGNRIRGYLISRGVLMQGRVAFP